MVHVNDEPSSIKTTPAGLPQGAVLSTSLFSLYISDIPHPPNSHLALYADDTAILTQSWRTDTIVNRLTQVSPTLLRYFTKWELRINVRKNRSNTFHQNAVPLSLPQSNFNTRPSRGTPTSVTSVSSLTPNSFLPHISLQSLIEPPALSSATSL